MKTVYPVVITQTDKGYVTYVPDLKINTQGKTLSEAIDMTRDAIGETVCYREDANLQVQLPSSLTEITCKENEIKTLVDVDLIEFRRKIDNRTERTNVSIPAWLKFKAEKAGLNFSQILQKALKEELSLTE